MSKYILFISYKGHFLTDYKCDKMTTIVSLGSLHPVDFLQCTFLFFPEIGSGYMRCFAFLPASKISFIFLN